MASSTSCAPSLAPGSLRRHSSEIRAICANERSYGSVRRTIINDRPYRDLSGLHGTTRKLLLVAKNSSRRRQTAQDCYDGDRYRHDHGVFTGFPFSRIADQYAAGCSSDCVLYQFKETSPTLGFSCRCVQITDEDRKGLGLKNRFQMTSKNEALKLDLSESRR
jgi:hypothetical protein